MNIPFLEFSGSQGNTVTTYDYNYLYYSIDCNYDTCKLCPKGPDITPGCAVITEDEYVYYQEHYPELFI